MDKMSWFRSAVSKAVEVGNKNNLTRTVKNYADTVVQQAGQAVAEGAKLLQDRIAVRNFKSVKQTIQRLEEAAVFARGPERAQLLKRWLTVLVETEKHFRGSVEEKDKTPEQQIHPDEHKDNPRKPSLVQYYDSDVGGEPLTFHDVFLQSQALEGIVLSMIIEAPKEEEVTMLLEIFGFCLSGGKEVHNAIVSSIQDLAKAFSGYQDEVLAKREELLQFAQVAISGLKISADVRRIETEASGLRKKLEEMTTLQKRLDEVFEGASKESTAETMEALKAALSQVRVCSRLEGLLMRKKVLSHGESPESHSQKVEKLKVLTESLANSSAKAEKRILDNRLQKEEALKVRLTKAGEVNEKEKEISAEISGLEAERDELEAKLKKVNISLAAAQARLRDVREERDQFEEANNQIVEQLRTKEDELSKSIVDCKTEVDVLKTWINFLEDTWVLQRANIDTREKEVNEELEKHEDYFMNLAIDLLSSYKKELEPAINRIEKYVENLKSLSEGSKLASGQNEDSEEINPRLNLEEEYLSYEAKIVTTFSVVDNMKELFYAQRGEIFRKRDSKVRELLDDIEKSREKFESIERPNLELEMPSPKSETPQESNSPKIETGGDNPSTKAETPNKKPPESSSELPNQDVSSLKTKVADHSDSSGAKAEHLLDTDAELARLESEFGKVAHEYSAEDIGGWEFDELERELKGDSPVAK